MELIKLTQDEFARVARIVHAKTGIHLAPEKVSMLSNRLRKRLRALNLDSFEAYYKVLTSREGMDEELSHFLSAVTTNETYFFRNERLWDLFTGQLIPHFVTTLGRRRSLRIWSAASSTGEEAYTAAIALCEHLPEWSRWNITIIGSDIGPRVLDQARKGVFNDYAVSRMEKAKVARWFDRRDDGYHLEDEVRRMVRFVQHNLRDPFPETPFNLIFLRNVLMYFDSPMKKSVLDVVTKALAPDGCLIVGDVDPIRTTPELRSCMTLEFRQPGVYWKPAVAAAPKPVVSA